MDGSICSVLKGSGSNQDPKRTNSSSKSGVDNNTGHVTPFQESLHSTIREQEASRERPRAANNTSKKSDTAHTSDQPQKVNAAPDRQHRTTEKTKAYASAKTEDAGQTQNQNTVVSPDGTDPALASAVLGNVQPLNNVAVDLASDSGAAAINGDSTPQAVPTVAAANKVELASETKPTTDKEALVFDASLHSAAPVPARPPQAALAGAGKPSWLLNSQLYAARQDSGQATDTNQQPAPQTDNKNQSENAGSATRQQTALQNIAAPSVQVDKSGASNAQTKPDAIPAQTNHEQAVPVGKTNMEQSSSDNTPEFEKDTKQHAADNAVNHQPDSAAPSPHVFQTSNSAPAKVDAAAPPNNAAATSSKSGVLSINQQTEIHQPSMKTDLNMRIQGQSGESINLRISERAGDIQISVRSSDQGTANVLKHELPSIEAGLERAGWRMDTGGMSQSGQDQQEASRDSQNPDRNREQNSQQQSNWQDRNQRRREPSPNPWFEIDQ
jgi:hypothetical protein